MTKLLRLMTTLILAVVTGCGLALLQVGTSGGQTAQAAASTALAASPELSQPSNGTVTNPPTWVVEADPYIHISTDAVATIDPAIPTTTLSQNDLALVRQADQQFNSSPLTDRQGPLTFSQDFPNFGCRMSITSHFQWWGDAILLNDCAVQTFVFAGLSIAGIAGIIGSVCPPCTPFAGVVAGVFAIDAGVMLWLDYECGGRGAYVDVTWGLIWWDAPVC